MSVMLDNKCFNRFLLSIFCWCLFYGVKVPINLFVGYLFTLLAVPQAKIWEKVEYYNQTFPESPYPILYVDPFEMFTILLFGFVVLALAGMELFQIAFVFFILRALESKKAALTEKSYRLQKQLTFALAAQLVVPIVLIFFPVSYGVICRYVGSDPSKMAGDIGFFLFATYGACNALLTIFFVKPYYDFTLRKLQRIFWCFKFEPPKKHSIVVLHSINSYASNVTANNY
uniref:G_PROTEIN_RECEP_F1_2 domain-containing protein n=2 Tax=Bursaphelenchus xylophilus TaxID=6326 RepID=A0A1I7RVT2_BURXY